MAEEQLADAYQAAIAAGWAKAELADAGVKEPPLVRRRREAEKKHRPSEQPNEYDRAWHRCGTIGTWSRELTAWW